VNANDQSNLQQHAANPCETECDAQRIETKTEDWDLEKVLLEIEAAEKRHERFAHALVHLPDDKVAVTEEMDLLLGIEHMEKTIERIVSSDDPATKQVKAAFGKDEFRYELTKLGDAVWRMCRETVPLVRQMFPDYGVPNRLMPAKEKCVPNGARPMFNPRITVACRACQRALWLLRWHAGSALDTNDPFVRRVLGHVLGTIRRVCRSRRFKYLENNYRQNAKLRFKAACKYMAELFERHSKLLILRIDLYFRPNQKEWADTAAAGRSIRSFMRALRDGRVLPDMAGWAYRIENGFRRGIHVHLLVAMDGHKHREAATWSKAVGAAWVTKYSAGHGSYFNCYIRKDWYKFNGLGLVHISDHAKLLGIREALRYMTKADFHIATGFTKNFRKGQPRYTAGAAKRGAPRNVDHGMQLVSQILGNA
jgi:hypothetical protein